MLFAFNQLKIRCRLEQISKKIDFFSCSRSTDRLAQSLSTKLLVWEARASFPGPVKSDTVSPTACQRCDVSSKLCCPSTKQRR